MEDRTVVSVRNLSKKFSRSLKRSFVYGAEDVMRAALGRPLNQSLRDSEFWALRDVSFDLLAGDAIGIVGLNGSGKTTLLRIISGVLRATTGEVEVNGRLAPMLALGAGFKPVLSGRENVFLNMSLLGVPHRRIREKFDEVVDFADLWDAIDAPLGTYSTGMQMRLGFACAIHTDPQILVIDEVLSVGDVRFRVKCRNKMNELRRAGVSMLIVSHSAISVETLTNHCLYLEKGVVKAQGAPADVLRLYEADTIARTQVANNRRLEQWRESAPSLATAHPAAPLRISSVRIENGTLQPADYWTFGEPGELVLQLAAHERVEDVSINVIITDMTNGRGENVQFLRSRLDVGALGFNPPAAEARLRFPHVGLRPGVYRMKFSLSVGSLEDPLDALDDFKVVVKSAAGSLNCEFYQPRSWLISTLQPGAAEVDMDEDLDPADVA